MSEHYSSNRLQIRSQTRPGERCLDFLVYRGIESVIVRRVPRTSLTFWPPHDASGSNSLESQLDYCLDRMANNRLPVYLLPNIPSESLPPSPPHRTSPSFAALLVNVSWAKYVKESDLKLGIVLTFRTTWAVVKEQFRGGHRPVPKLLPPRQPENLDISYPARGWESTRHAHQAFLTACQQARGAQ